MKDTLIFLACFMCLSVCEAMQFKVDGYRIYWKQDNVKEYGDFDFVCLTGTSKPKLNRDGSPDMIFVDKSDIVKIIEDSLHCYLIVEKKKSKWILNYEGLYDWRDFPEVIMIYPDISAKELQRNYIKQIYPMSKELNK